MEWDLVFGLHRSRGNGQVSSSFFGAPWLVVGGGWPGDMDGRGRALWRRFTCQPGRLGCTTAVLTFESLVGYADGLEIVGAGFGVGDCGGGARAPVFLGWCWCNVNCFFL